MTSTDLPFLLHICLKKDHQEPPTEKEQNELEGSRIKALANK